MKEFKVTWKDLHEAYVEADNEEQAIEIAKSRRLKDTLAGQEDTDVAEIEK